MKSLFLGQFHRLLFYSIAMPAGLTVSMLLLGSRLSVIIKELIKYRYYQISGVIIGFIIDLTVQEVIRTSIYNGALENLGISAFFGIFGGTLAIIYRDGN